jgi:hypothetical protein
LRLRLLSLAGRLAAAGLRTLLHVAQAAPFTGLALEGLHRLDARAAPAERVDTVSTNPCR